MSENYRVELSFKIVKGDSEKFRIMCAEYFKTSYSGSGKLYFCIINNNRPSTSTLKYNDLIIDGLLNEL